LWLSPPVERPVPPPPPQTAPDPALSDIELERILDQEPLVIPDSQPLVPIERPPSPPPADHMVYPRVQFRVGKKDWSKLQLLADHLTDLKDHIEFLNEFLDERKTQRQPLGSIYVSILNLLL